MSKMVTMETVDFQS